MNAQQIAPLLRGLTHNGQTGAIVHTVESLENATKTILNSPKQSETTPKLFKNAFQIVCFRMGPFLLSSA